MPSLPHGRSIIVFCGQFSTDSLVGFTLFTLRVFTKMSDFESKYYASSDDAHFLRKENEELKKDAERYRWLRGHCENICGLHLSWYVPEDNIEWGEDAPSFDVAIDSAMARARPRAEGGMSMSDVRGCGDHNCIFGHPGGMGTNGGCRCLDLRRDLRRNPDRRIGAMKNILVLRAENLALRAENERLLQLLRESRTHLMQGDHSEWRKRVEAALAPTVPRGEGGWA